MAQLKAEKKNFINIQDSQQIEQAFHLKGCIWPVGFWKNTWKKLAEKFSD